MPVKCGETLHKKMINDGNNQSHARNVLSLRVNSVPYFLENNLTLQQFCLFVLRILAMQETKMSNVWAFGQRLIAT